MGGGREPTPRAAGEPTAAVRSLSAALGVVAEHRGQRFLNRFGGTVADVDLVNSVLSITSSAHVVSITDLSSPRVPFLAKSVQRQTQRPLPRNQSSARTKISMLFKHCCVQTIFDPRVCNSTSFLCVFFSKSPCCLFENLHIFKTTFFCPVG